MSSVQRQEQVPQMNVPKLHIEFSVKDPETDRYVTFASDVPMTGLSEFFARAALGIEHIFETIRAPVAIRLKTVPTNKIAAIKTLRELTQCDLLTAKNTVEAGGTLLVCDDGRDANDVMQRFEHDGISVTCIEFKGDPPAGFHHLRLKKGP